MEADWEFEVGGDAPVIDACWPGFVDLRFTLHGSSDPQSLARGLPEAAQFPGLAVALAALNALDSPFFTSKCDFWPVLGGEEFDADEVAAPPGSAAHAMGCYLDLLPLSDQPWSLPQAAAAGCEGLCARLRAIPLDSSRVDLIIRRAHVAPGRMDFGFTAYFTACGPTVENAARTLNSALAAFVDAIEATRRYNRTARASSSTG